MVWGTSIGIGTIASFLMGVLSKIGYDEYTRWRDRVAAEKREKKEWYSDLIALSREIKHRTPAYIRNLQYLESVNPGENQMLNILSEEERKELDEQLGDVSLDDYEDIAEADAVNMWIRKRNEIKDDLAVDMKMYEERLNQQLAQPPEDVDNELIETGAELLSQLNCVGTIGTINEEIAININQVAEELVSMCSDAISELE